MQTVEQEKQALLKRLAEIEANEKSSKVDITKEQNYKDFLNRESDMIVGRSHHCRISSKKMGLVSVTVSGNCSETYKENVALTSETTQYFHNVWTFNQRYEFQKRLTSFIEQEINKIISNPHQVVELMGLQYNPCLENIYPKDKIESVKEDIKKSQWEVLDKFSDEELTAIPYDLSHGGTILFDYLASNRKHLFEKRKKKIR